MITFAPIFILAVFCYKTSESKVILNGKTFSVEVVSTKPALERGLSGHKPLLDNQGMLFVFQKPDNYGFWMKNMFFPIDIIWIGADWKVVHMEKSVSASTYPKIFFPNSPAQYVLEVNSGISDAINLKVGDTAKFVKK